MIKYQAPNRIESPNGKSNDEFSRLRELNRQPYSPANDLYYFASLSSI